MKRYYVVHTKVSYVTVNFKFDTISGACNFMEMFIDHAEVVDRGDNIEVWLERVDEEGQKGEE